MCILRTAPGAIALLGNGFCLVGFVAGRTITPGTLFPILLLGSSPPSAARIHRIKIEPNTVTCRPLKLCGLSVPFSPTFALRLRASRSGRSRLRRRFSVVPSSRSLVLYLTIDGSRSLLLLHRSITPAR
jgi:hypothetical protein